MVRDYGDTGDSFSVVLLRTGLGGCDAGGDDEPRTDGSTSYVYDDQGLPIEQIDGADTPLYYQHDQLGSTRLLTSDSGTVAGTFRFDPYGNLTGHTGSSDTPLRWAGQYQDGNGLYYLRARYYDPATAQFLTRDPLAAVTLVVGDDDDDHRGDADDSLEDETPVAKAGTLHQAATLLAHCPVALV